MIGAWCRYTCIQDWPWIESSLRLTLNFDSVHAYRGAVLSAGLVGRPKEEAVLSKGIQMFLETSVGNQMSAFTYNTGGCSAVEMLRRYGSLHVFSKL